VAPDKFKGSCTAREAAAATTDGGAGALAALGARFFDAAGAAWAGVSRRLRGRSSCAGSTSSR
jgi:glycerate kinase